MFWFCEAKSAEVALAVAPKTGTGALLLAGTFEAPPKVETVELLETFAVPKVAVEVVVGCAEANNVEPPLFVLFLNNPEPLLKLESVDELTWPKMLLFVVENTDADVVEFVLENKLLVPTLLAPPPGFIPDAGVLVLEPNTGMEVVFTDEPPAGVMLEKIGIALVDANTDEEVVVVTLEPKTGVAVLFGRVKVAAVLAFKLDDVPKTAW